MKKHSLPGILGIVLIFSLALTGCPMDSSDDDDSPGGPSGGGDPLGLASVTINGVAVDIGFKGTVGFAGSEGWGFNNGGAQNGGIYSAPDAAALSSVTVVAVPQDSGASVGYAFSAYSASPPANAADPEFSSPETFSSSGALGALSDLDFIAVEVTKGENKAWYKFRVAIDAPLLGANGVSAGGTKLGWTIPDLQWTHNQGAYFHNNVGPNPEQSIGLIIQDTLPLAGRTLTADVPEGATATWGISTGGNNNTGVTAPAAWNPITTALPSTITSGSLLTVRVVKGGKTLYYNWWVYSTGDVKLSTLSVAGNVVDPAKLTAFTDSWSGAALKEIIVPVEDTEAILEGAKIAWTEPLGMGLAIAVTDGTSPAEDDWQGTSRGQNESYAIVVQPPAVDLKNNDVLSIRAKISEKVWYYKAKISFRSLEATDADLTGLSVGGVAVTNLGTPGDSVQVATAGQPLTLNLTQATGAAIAPLGGPNAEFLFIKGDGTATPGNTAGWSSTGTISFDTGDYLIIQAFAGELPSKYYKFQVTVTYPNADDVKLASLSIGGANVDETDLGTPWVDGGSAGTKGAAEIGPAQNDGSVIGAVPEAAAGSTIKYAQAVQGAEPANAEDWKEATLVSNPFGPPTLTYPTFTFADNDELWVKVAAGTQTVKTYKIVITTKTWAESDAVLDSLAINGDFNFENFTYGYTVPVTDLGTPNAEPGSVTAGSFSVEAGKGTGFGPGLYVNAVSNSGATIHFAKSATVPAEETGWTPSMSAMGPASFEFANDNIFWIRVTAGAFVKYYKFTVTVTPAGE